MILVKTLPFGCLMYINTAAENLTVPTIELTALDGLDMARRAL